MNRRQFTSQAAAFVLLLASTGTSLLLTGCNLFSDILNWIPVGEAALNSILTVLSSNGVIVAPQAQAIIALINAGFTALTAAVQEYQSTTPPPVGALAKVQTAFRDITDNFGTFLQSLTVPNSILGIITGLAGIVLSTIGAFVNKLPQTPALAKTAVIASSVKVNGNTLAIVPKGRTARSFRSDWNKTLDAGVKSGANIPKAAYL